MTIFDRSWYGRVLVERVEKFAKPEEWKRAYEEINAFEKQLLSQGTVLCKFWIHISPEKQMERFQKRLESTIKDTRSQMRTGAIEKNGQPTKKPSTK